MIPSQLASIIQSQSEIISAGLDLDLVMRTIALRTQDLTGASGAVLELVEGDEMVYRSVSGTAAGQLGLRLNKSTSLSGRCVSEKRILLCTDSENDQRVDRDACRKVGARSMIVVPLFGLPSLGSEGSAKAIGVLKVLSTLPNAFGNAETEVLTLMAALVSAAINNAGAFHQREELLRKLRASEERFRTLAEAAFESIFISREGKITDANDRAGDIFGYSREELIGKHISELTVPEMKAQLMSEVMNNPSSEYENKGVHKSGKIISVEIHGRTFEENGDKYRVSVIRDITSRKQFERELVEAKKAAIHANEMKSRFLLSMSHELRTPIGGILGFADLVLTEDLGPINDDQRNALSTILKSSRHLLQVIDDVLDLGKVEAGKMELQRELFDPIEAAQEVVDSQQALAGLRQVTLSLSANSLDPNFDFHNQFRCNLDLRKYKQILYNLISNAIKFTKEGGCVFVGLEITNDELHLSVRDTGVGMTAEGVAQLFKDFTQIDSPQGRQSVGTGLGLVLTRDLVELHGGAITVESTPNVGSIFHVYLPI